MSRARAGRPVVRRCVLRTKPGYSQAIYSRGILLIYLALDTVCRQRLEGMPRTLTLTSGTDSHTRGGHVRGEAVDVRSRSFASGWAKRAFLEAVLGALGTVRRVRDGAVGFEVFTRDYYGLLEAEGDPREHLHIQVRRGRLIGLDLPEFSGLSRRASALARPAHRP